jgi:hypothetical protein
MTTTPYMMRRWSIAFAMAVLSLPPQGSSSAAILQKDGGTYGRELAVTGHLGVGPTMAVAVQEQRLYTIGQQTLRIADISDPANPRVLGSLGGLGSVRQIVVARDVAYITSREDGLFIVSVKNPAAPTLLCHYDTVEWATGVAISGDALFIACRQYGVELVDVSDPAHPRHLSNVRTGEAQSVVARDGWLYAGVWGTSEVVIADIHDPRAPRIVARAPLDGYGDGVTVCGKYLYAATGHHSRAPHKKEGEPGYGRGHGLEIFDITDPAKPVFVSRVKFPRFFAVGRDMWSATIAGDHAFVADTHNGIFVVDVKDVRHPQCVAHHQLPPVAGQQLPDFAGGLALAQNYIYVAGGDSDLHVLTAPGLALPPKPEPDTPPAITPQKESTETTYRPEGQIHAAALLGSNAVLACGAAGIHVVKLAPKVELLSIQPTEDFAMDVCVLGDRLFVAEGTGGLSIWAAKPDGSLTLLGRYRVAEKRVRHLAVPPPGRFALLEVGSVWLHLVDVSDPAAPKLVSKESHHGLLYGHQIMQGLIEQRYAGVFWHASGLYWFDILEGRALGQVRPDRYSMLSSLAALNDKEILNVRLNGYVVHRRTETRSLDELPLRRIAGHPFGGKPTVVGRRLYLAERASGKVTILDIADVTAPKLVTAFTTPGNPGRIVATPHNYLIPDGYNGLIIRQQEKEP